MNRNLKQIILENGHNEGVDLFIERYRLRLRNWAIREVGAFVSFGECNVTKLGELIADSWGLTYLNHDIPEEIFDIAFDASELVLSVK